MVYTANTPQANQTIAQTQPLINANFQAINTVVAVNHVAFDDANQGKHKFMQMPEQVAAPTTAVNEGALYTKEAGASTQLFYRDENNGTERQITGAYTAATNGSLTIPGGLFIQWGTANVTQAAGTVTFNTPFTTAVYNIQLTPKTGVATNAVVTVDDATITLTNFVVKTQLTNQTVFWWAIGI